jgi:cell division transport system ATP-binding protein
MKVVFEAVNKNYGIINALKDINFTINKGEFVFIAGPSGSGKSTMLKLILHQIMPNSGRILLDDLDFFRAKKSDIDKLRRQIGVIFQDYQLIPDKTIEENISLVLDIINFPPEQIPSRVDEVLNKVGLSSRRFLFPSQLSGGELQRTTLARALAVNPKLILADEPTGNLDVENSWHLLKLLKDINRHDQATVIMTTHNLDILRSFPSRIIYLRNGKIEKETPL